jgi:uncharacterized protein (DUF4415 family)
MSKICWNEDKQSGTITITQEDYAAARARGLASEETMQPGQHRFERGGFLKRHGLTPAEVEAAPVQIEIKLPLDDDVLNYFKQCAAAAGAASYHTYLNDVLRQVMKSECNSDDTLAPVKQQLLADTQFIDALAAEVAAQVELRQAA